MPRVAVFEPKIWSAGFLRALRANTVWVNRATRQYEGELRVGTSIEIPRWTKEVTITPYVEGSDLPAPESPTGETVTLTINKQPAFNITVGKIGEVQSKPALMERFMDQAIYRRAIEVDTDVRAEFVTNYDATKHIDTAGAVDSDGWGEAFLKSIALASNRMDKLHIPMEGRYLIVHPDHIYGCNLHFGTTGSDNIYTPGISEETLRNGFAGQLLGFDLFVTTRTHSVTDSGTTYHAICAGQSNLQVAHVQQIQSVIPYIPEKRFEDAVKGLIVYGTKTIEGGSLQWIRTTQVA